jgi:hypothetical protein
MEFMTRDGEPPRLPSPDKWDFPPGSQGTCLNPDEIFEFLTFATGTAVPTSARVELLQRQPAARAQAVGELALQGVA